MASSESVNDFFRQQTLKEPKLVQLDKGVWFIAMHSKGKSMTGPVIIEKAKYLYDEMKITDRCRFSQSSNEKLPCKKFDNPTPLQCHGCQITRIVLFNFLAAGYS
jgi:hypothetical protein